MQLIPAFTITNVLLSAYAFIMMIAHLTSKSRIEYRLFRSGISCIIAGLLGVAVELDPQLKGWALMIVGTLLVIKGVRLWKEGGTPKPKALCTPVTIEVIEAKFVD